MLKSMTGFAQAESRYKDIHLNIEMRSLNHRYLECITHIPEGFGAVEEMVKERTRTRLARGRVTIVVSVSRLHPKISVDYDLAENYVRTLKQLNQRLKLHDNLSLGQIINLEGVIKIEKISLSDEFLQVIKSLIDKAVEKLALIRQKEGRAITADILRRLAVIKKEAEKINHNSLRLTQEKKKLLSEDEYGVFLKNTDIAEELTRIAYHVKNFLDTVRKSATCGKELDFIAQEIQREANTISAKAQSAKVSSSVVKIKSAIDRIREQVQNVE